MGSGLRTFFGLGLLAVGILATIGTILGFFGNAWWAFDVLASFRLQYLVVLLVVGLLYGFLFGWGAAIVFLAAAAVNAYLLLPLWAGSQPSAASQERIRIVTLDVSANTNNKPRVIEWLRGVDADLVFLEQTTDAWVVAIEETELPYTIIAAPHEDQNFGIIALAKDGALTGETILLGQTGDAIVEVATTLGGNPISLYAVAAREPNGEADAERREAVLQAAAEIVKASGGTAAVVGGFNASLWSSAYLDFLATAGLEDSSVGFGYQPTWPSQSIPFVDWLFAIPVDGLARTGSITTTARSIGPDLDGEHRAVIIEIAPASTGT